MFKILFLTLVMSLDTLAWSEQIEVGSPWVEGNASPVKEGETVLRWYRTENAVSAFVVRHGAGGASGASGASVPVSLEVYDGEQQVLRIDDIANSLTTTEQRFLVSDCTPFPPLKNGTMQDRYVLCYDRMRKVTFLIALNKKTGVCSGDVSAELLNQTVTWWNATRQP